MKKKRTRACEIPKSVKEKVYERDGGCCVNCGKPGISNAHFIARSQGGLGIEENILTLCVQCHRTFDNTHHRHDLKEKFREYLKSKYPHWDEKKLIYRKWEGLTHE